MKRIFPLILSLSLFACNNSNTNTTGNVATDSTQTVKGGSELITFVGRTDYSNADAPKQWAAGAYFTFAFTGEYCEIVLNDEVVWGKNHNIMEIAIDNNPTVKIRCKDKVNRFVIGTSSKNYADTANVIKVDMKLSNEEHHVTICRDQETAMGFTQPVEITAAKITKWTPETSQKIEFIGNSITCGAESDTADVSIKDYQWGDWHRAYYGYGPRTARNLNAQYSLVSVSGIGLIHSCCDMEITMPQVYDKIQLRDNKNEYDFSYKPDLITICLGENDGVQNDKKFTTAYIDFIKTVIEKNPQVKRIILLSSPMASPQLKTWMQKVLPQVVEKIKADGFANISYYMFSKSWNEGGMSHPSVEQHEEIANELTEYIKSL